MGDTADTGLCIACILLMSSLQESSVLGQSLSCLLLIVNSNVLVVVKNFLYCHY